MAGYVMLGLGLSNDPWDYRFFPIELPLFLWGALAYKAYACFEGRKLLRADAGRAALALVLTGVLLHTKIPGSMQTGPLGLPLMCLVLGPALPFLFHLTRDWARDRWIGELSYPVSIVHLMVVALLKELGWLSQLGLSAVVISILLAILLRVFIEDPVDRWRHADSAPDDLRAPTEPSPSERIVEVRENSVPLPAVRGAEF